MKKEGDSFFCCPPLGFYSYMPCVRPRPEIGNADLHTPMGGVLQEKIFLKVRFQKWVGNSPTKSDFDFGRRTCRLCAIEGSLIQK